MPCDYYFSLDKNIDQLYTIGMKKINASKFKEQSLSILDSLEPEGIVITKHGKPVAKLIPIQEQSAHLIGSMKGKIKIKGDVFSTGVRWNVES
jgi:prevent-host-death family protein